MVKNSGNKADTKVVKKVPTTIKIIKPGETYKGRPIKKWDYHLEQKQLLIEATKRYLNASLSLTNTVGKDQTIDKTIIGMKVIGGVIGKEEMKKTINDTTTFKKSMSTAECLAEITHIVGDSIHKYGIDEHLVFLTQQQVFKENHPHYQTKK